ncbi:hypothetical protein AYL99_04123 [Fonsecaea erecta]|uniref:Uncharacterized protein n=1 Tax=Fonsecaea erecta TaxID=1367422 RepID=A0A178ZQ35_9EURO|nr:hypothetical protein AYL99_04123 [Fonsecaea erecta]OAP61920.1 hypothetical protein AYL99_04123 [Fonsecaea erecta]
MTPTRTQDVEYEVLHPGQHGRKDGTTPRAPRTWKVALSMACSIIAGLVFALVHHFFYTYWNGKVVSSDAQQRWIIRGGTAFAFGLKTTLALGTSIAYVQYFWLTVCSKEFEVGKINSIFKVLGNAFELCDLKLWFRLPVLASLAIVTWTLPIAAIISPGTLIVTPSTGNRTEHLGVPQFDYRDYTPFASPLPSDDAKFAGASNTLVQLALGSATTQSILSISPPVANSTYAVKMYAPALTCQVPARNDSLAIEGAYTNYADTSGGFGINYMAWVPYGDGAENGCQNGSIAIPSDLTTNKLPSTTDSCYDGYSAKLNIFIPFNTASDATFSESSVLLNCSLMNASYTVNFDFRDRAQRVNVQSRELLNGVAGLSSYEELFDDSPSMFNKLLSYMSVNLQMDAFGRIMVGTINTDHYGTITPAYTLVLSTGLRSQLSGVTNNVPSTSNATFARSVENLFENMTMSLLSSNDFIVDFSNETEAAGTPLTAVTIYYPQNIYTYEAAQLWLAYGIAILANVLCLLTGMFAMRRNGLSYSNDFTTIMRTTRNPNLDLLVPEAESNGAEPVAPRTKKGTLTYQRSNEYGWAGFSAKGMQY